MTQITGFELLLRRWVRNSSADLEANPTTQSQGTVGIDAHRRASHIEPFLFIKVFLAKAKAYIILVLAKYIL